MMFVGELGWGINSVKKGGKRNFYTLRTPLFP